jgi:hypothetical protein
VAWVAAEDTAVLHQTLCDLGLVGLQLTGQAADPILGQRRGASLARRVKQALDPNAVLGMAV